MTAQDLMNICSQMPYDAKVRFTCLKADNPHTDYYDVDGAYLLQFQTGKDPDCALYLHGNE